MQKAGSTFLGISESWEVFDKRKISHAVQHKLDISLLRVYLVQCSSVQGSIVRS